MSDRPARARFTEELGFVADLTIEGWLDDVLNEHAHHLAEQIRQDTTVMGEAGDQYALCYADLIDPEAQR